MLWSHCPGPNPRLQGWVASGKPTSSSVPQFPPLYSVDNTNCTAVRGLTYYLTVESHITAGLACSKHYGVSHNTVILRRYFMSCVKFAEALSAALVTIKPSS